MPGNEYDESVSPQSISFWQRLKRYAKRKTAAPLELYALGEEAVFAFDDIWTPLRNPEAVLSLGLHHVNADAFIAHHPVVTIGAFSAGAVLSATRVGLKVYDDFYDDRPNSQREILRLLRLEKEKSNQVSAQKESVDERPVSATLFPRTEEDDDLLNNNAVGFADDEDAITLAQVNEWEGVLNARANRLKLPYKVKAFFKKKNVQPNDLNQTFKKDEVFFIPCYDAEQYKIKPTLLQRTLLKVFDNFVTRRILQPFYEAGNKTSIAYWITWFGAVLIVGTITGALAFGVTGTAAVTTAATAGVFGIPLLIAGTYLALQLREGYRRSKLQKKLNKAEATKLDGEKESLVPVHGQEAIQVLARLMIEGFYDGHEKSLEGICDEYLSEKGVSVNKELKPVQKIEPDDEESIESLSSSAAPKLSYYQRFKKFIDDELTWKQRFQVAWASTKALINGYIMGFFVLNFAISAVTAVAKLLISAAILKTAAIAVVGGLSLSVGGGLTATGVGLPVALLVMLGGGILIGTIAAIKTSSDKSHQLRKQNAIFAKEPWLEPKTLAGKERALMEEYNKLKEKFAGEPDSLKLIEKLDYAAQQAKDPAFAGRTQSKPRVAFEYGVTALQSFGIGFVARSLLIASVVTFAVAAFAHPIGYITGPIAVPILVGVAIAGWIGISLVERYIKSRDQHSDIDALRLKHSRLQHFERSLQLVEQNEHHIRAGMQARHDRLAALETKESLEPKPTSGVKERLAAIFEYVKKPAGYFGTLKERPNVSANDAPVPRFSRLSRTRT